MSIYIDNGKTVEEYYTDKRIEKAIRYLLNSIEDIMSSETSEGYTVEIKERKSTEIQKTYEDGINDAWECVQKIDSDRNLEEYVIEHGYANISYEEAMDKIQEYEEKHSEPSMDDKSLMDDYLEELIDTAGQKNFIPAEIKQREPEPEYIPYRPKKR